MTCRQGVAYRLEALPDPSPARPARRSLSGMDHADHVALIQDGVAGLEHGAWADLGSGRGAFTLALADLLGPVGSIVSVDRDGGSLRGQEAIMRERFPTTPVRYIQADLRDPLAIGPLDGVVMANALHFIADKRETLAGIHAMIRPGGHLVLIEYDSDRGNPWVPHALSFPTWKRAAAEAGFRETRLLKRVPSRFLSAIYSALSLR